ncbi:hypothetical protein PFISCL1PPCAC_11782, partial [Pristionchus fissidentatus]
EEALSTIRRPSLGESFKKETSESVLVATTTTAYAPEELQALTMVHAKESSGAMPVVEAVSAPNEQPSPRLEDLERENADLRIQMAELKKKMEEGERKREEEKAVSDRKFKTLLMMV